MVSYTHCWQRPSAHLSGRAVPTEQNTHEAGAEHAMKREREIGNIQRTLRHPLLRGCCCLDSRVVGARVSSAGSTLPGGCKRRGPRSWVARRHRRGTPSRGPGGPLLCVCTKVARSWVARPRLACPGCRRSTSGLVRSQCRTSWPSPSERSPNPGASARGSS